MSKVLPLVIVAGVLAGVATVLIVKRSQPAPDSNASSAARPQPKPDERQPDPAGKNAPPPPVAVKNVPAPPPVSVAVPVKKVEEPAADDEDKEYMAMLALMRAKKFDALNPAPARAALKKVASDFPGTEAGKQALEIAKSLTDGAATVWLAEATPTDFEVGWGSFDPGTHKLNGESIERSIFAHANSRAVYKLKGKWKTFESRIGIRNSVGGSVIFIVKGDGKELFRSDVIRKNDAETVKVDVTGVDMLELLTDINDDRGYSDHSAWFGPRVSR